MNTIYIPGYPISGKTVPLKLTCTEGASVEFHIDASGEMIIDRSNVQLSESDKDLICPPWIREIVKNGAV